jgi:hypothetical protein
MHAAKAAVKPLRRPHAAAAVPREELPLSTGPLRGKVSILASLPTSTLFVNCISAEPLVRLPNPWFCVQPNKSRDMDSAFDWKRMLVIRMVDPTICSSAPGAFVRGFCLALNLVIGLI